MKRHVLLCYRVEDVANGPPVQSLVGSCENCGKGIWVALSSPDSNVERWCFPCARDAGVLKQGTFRPPTRKQLAEVVKYFREQQ